MLLVVMIWGEVKQFHVNSWFNLNVSIPSQVVRHRLLCPVDPNRLPVVCRWRTEELACVVNSICCFFSFLLSHSVFSSFPVISTAHHSYSDLCIINMYARICTRIYHFVRCRRWSGWWKRNRGSLGYTLDNSENLLGLSACTNWPCPSELEKISGPFLK